MQRSIVRMEKLLKTRKEELSEKQENLKLSDREILKDITSPPPGVVMKQEFDPVWTAAIVWFYFMFYAMPIVILPFLYG